MNNLKFINVKLEDFRTKFKELFTNWVLSNGSIPPFFFLSNGFAVPSSLSSGGAIYCRVLFFPTFRFFNYDKTVAQIEDLNFFDYTNPDFFIKVVKPKTKKLFICQLFYKLNMLVNF